MIDPLKEPVLSLMLSSKDCPVEVLPLLQALPIDNLNRTIDASVINSPKPHASSRISILELLLLRNRGESMQSVHNSLSLTTQIAIELVRQGSALTNTGVWSDGETRWDILDLAFTHGHYKFVEFLLDGPLQHLTSTLVDRKDGGTPWLHTAVQTQNIELVKKILAWGVDCNEIAENGRTALYYVKTPEVLSLLLKSGARVDAVETDIYGSTLSDQWNNLPAVDVKKLNATLFKSLKNSGDFDEKSMQASWMENLLHSSKGVIVDQQKKLKIPQNFTWSKDGVSVTPLVWMALQKNKSRNTFQQSKVVSHFATQPQNIPVGKMGGMSLSNLDVLVFLEVMLSGSYKDEIGLGGYLFLQKWMEQNTQEPVGDQIEKLCTTLTHTAVLVQSLPWVSDAVAYTGFDWYDTLFAGRQNALPQYSAFPRVLLNQIAKMLPHVQNKEVEFAIGKGLQTAWELPATQTLKETALLNPFFDQTSLRCLYDLAHNVFERSESPLEPHQIKNIIRALTHETARCQNSYYTKKNMYNPTPKFEQEFGVLVSDVLGRLEATSFGVLFEDPEWARLSKVYTEQRRISSTDENYATWEKIKSLMERETISRQLTSSPTVSSKRKL